MFPFMNSSGIKLLELPLVGDQTAAKDEFLKFHFTCYFGNIKVY